MDLESYYPMVRRIARRFARKLPATVDLDDLCQVGYMGLLEAAQRYDNARRASFATFARHRIHGAMLDELRRARLGPRYIESDKLPIIVPYIDEVRSGDDDVERNVLVTEIVSHIEASSERTRAVLSSFVTGRHDSRIASALGLSESRISQIRKDALARMSQWVS